MQSALQVEEMSSDMTLDEEHEVLGSEYCSGYTDTLGKWNNGFYCPSGDSQALYCCGTPTNKYCCARRDHVSRDDFSSSLPLLLGVVLIVIAAVTIVTLMSCCFCSCCILYKKRQPTANGGPLYRLHCSSTASGVANMYSFSNQNSLASTPIDTAVLVDLEPMVRDSGRACIPRAHHTFSREPEPVSQPESVDDNTSDATVSSHLRPAEPPPPYDSPASYNLREHAQQQTQQHIKRQQQIPQPPQHPPPLPPVQHQLSEPQYSQQHVDHYTVKLKDQYRLHNNQQNYQKIQTDQEQQWHKQQSLPQEHHHHNYQQEQHQKQTTECEQHTVYQHHNKHDHEQETQHTQQHQQQHQQHPPRHHEHQQYNQREQPPQEHKLQANVHHQEEQQIQPPVQEQPKQQHQHRKQHQQQQQLKVVNPTQNVLDSQTVSPSISAVTVSPQPASLQAQQSDTRDSQIESPETCGSPESSQDTSSASGSPHSVIRKVVGTLRERSVSVGSSPPPPPPPSVVSAHSLPPTPLQPCPNDSLVHTSSSRTSITIGPDVLTDHMVSSVSVPPTRGQSSCPQTPVQTQMPSFTSQSQTPVSHMTEKVQIQGLHPGSEVKPVGFEGKVYVQSPGVQPLGWTQQQVFRNVPPNQYGTLPGSRTQSSVPRTKIGPPPPTRSHPSGPPVHAQSGVPPRPPVRGQPAGPAQGGKAQTAPSGGSSTPKAVDTDVLYHSTKF